MYSLLSLLVPSALALAAPPQHDASPAEIAAAVAANHAYHATLHTSAMAPPTTPFRPVEDTANFAYVLMSAYDGDSSEVSALRETVARNLPSGVKLVVLADAGDADNMREQYGQWISPDRLIVASGDSTQEGFWARDSFPVPVFDDAKKTTSLVAAHYYRDFSAWDAVAGSVGAGMTKQGFTFVGGNLLADEDGTCFSVDSYRLFTVNQQDITQAYGCKTWHLMKHVRGLGDVDEVLKPLGGKRMLTNSPEYKADLESWGYTVILVPTSPEEYRTYVNSLVVNGTVFLPVYGVSQDDDAKKVYESLGYKVVTASTVSLSDDMHGSIHCQTMAYPAMPVGDLLKSLHAHVAP